MTGIAGGAETILEELADASLGQRKTEREDLAQQPGPGHSELGRQRIDAVKLTPREPEHDPTIERLKVRTVKRHDVSGLLGRPVGVPNQWDRTRIVIGRQHRRESLVESVVEIIGGDRQGVRMGLQDVTKNRRLGPLTTDQDIRAEDPKSLDSLLDVQQANRITSRRLRKRGAAKVS